jgi:adenylyl cyclase-associated protein
VNAITLDGCTRTGLVLQDLVAACELVNSASVQVQVTGKVPTIAVDKCDGVQARMHAPTQASCRVCVPRACMQLVLPAAAAQTPESCGGGVKASEIEAYGMGAQLYLSAASLGADITTAKSSEVNVAVPGASEDADLVEHALPEQFLSRFEGGRFVTMPVSHSGG